MEQPPQPTLANVLLVRPCTSGPVDLKAPGEPAEVAQVPVAAVADLVAELEHGSIHSSPRRSGSSLHRFVSLDHRHTQQPKRYAQSAIDA